VLRYVNMSYGDVGVSCRLSVIPEMWSLLVIASLQHLLRLQTLHLSVQHLSRSGCKIKDTFIPENQHSSEDYHRYDHELPLTRFTKIYQVVHDTTPDVLQTTSKLCQSQSLRRIIGMSPLNLSLEIIKIL